MGKGQRVKGHGFERWVANQLKQVFPDAKRHLEFQGTEARGFDLDNTGQYHIQCKAYRGYAPISKIQEVHPEDGFTPVLVTKGDYLEPMAVLPLSAFIELLKGNN